MSIATRQLAAHLKHRGLLFWTYFVPVVFYVAITVLFAVAGRVETAFSLAAVLALAAATGFFLASAQHEMLSRATFFLMPGISRGMARNQLLVGIVVGIAALIAGYVAPGLRPIVVDAPGAAMSVACLAMLVYLLMLLVIFQFAFSSLLLFQVMWLQVFLILPLKGVPAERISQLLDQPLLLAAGVGLAAFLGGQQVRSRTLHRRIAERPYLSIADVKNPGRVAEYKRARSLHKTEHDAGPRPFAGLLATGLRRVAAARAAGRNGRALVLEATLLASLAALPHQRWKLVLWSLPMPLLMVMGGYFDARNAFTGSDLEAWFVGLPFIAVMYFSQVALYLRQPAAGRLCARDTRRRALWPALGLIAAGGLVITAVLFAFGHVAASLLPPISWRGHELHMVAPRWDVFGVILFTLPVQMLVWALWRNPRCQSVLQQIGTVVFFIYHGLVRIVGGEAGLAIAGGIALVSLLVLPFVWRWRVMATDQA